MSRIHREELALNIGRQIVHPGKPFDFRRLALGLADIGIDIFVNLFLCVLIQRSINETLEHCRATHHVLACNNVKWCRVRLQALSQPLGNVRSYELQNIGANGCGNYICFNKGFQKVIQIRVAVDGLYIFH